MASMFLKNLRALPLEEKILNAGVLCCLIGLVFPWLEGQISLIEETTHTYSGLQFHTSFIGLTTLLLSIFVLLITLVPLSSKGVLVRKEMRDGVRLICTSICTILILAALSVLLKVTFQSPGMQLRFGIYLALIGSMVANLYAFLGWQDQKRHEVRALFHHPEPEAEPKKEPENLPEETPKLSDPDPSAGSMPPPPTPEPEEHPHRV